MQISTEQFKNVYRKLYALPGNKVNTALSYALSRAMITVRSEAWKYVHEQYTISRTAFYKDTGISTKVVKANSASGNAEVYAEIVVGGNLIRLVDFEYYKPDKYQNHQAKNRRIAAVVLRGLPSYLHAFVANFGRYGNAIYERLSPKRRDVKQMYGPSAAHMVMHPEVLKKLDKAAQETFDKRLEHEIDRILRGFGTPSYESVEQHREQLLSLIHI